LLIQVADSVFNYGRARVARGQKSVKQRAFPTTLFIPSPRDRLPFPQRCRVGDRRAHD
jgi:hypothetical protein